MTDETLNPDAHASTDPGDAANRRETRRFEVALSASERSGPFEVVWTTTDLSTRGLSMRESFSRPVGTHVHLALDLADGEDPLDVEAEVVGPFDLNGGIRVSFGSLTDADRARIEAALDGGSGDVDASPTAAS